LYGREKEGKKRSLTTTRSRKKLSEFRPALRMATTRRKAVEEDPKP
jgi:hypothetical protein